MNRLLKLAKLSLVVCCFTLIARGNPIEIRLINEIFVDDLDGSGWAIELDLSMFYLYDMDGWYLTTLEDTAYINPGFILDSLTSINVIRNQDLQTDLTINATNDVIGLHDETNGWDEHFRFGEIENADLAAPGPGQSMSRIRTWRYFWCLDNSPTLGFPNDVEGTIGTVEGHVYSTTGPAINGAWIIYEYLPFSPDTLFSATDETGYYTIEKSSELRFLRIFAVGYVPSLEWVQVWPDSTVTQDFYLTPVVSIDEKKRATPDEFELKQNYPNPFNASTIIEYGLPEAAHVAIDVFKLDGSHIAKLLDKKKPAGSYEISWNAQSVSSGIYVYTVASGDIKLSKKMILLK